MYSVNKYCTNQDSYMAFAPIPVLGIAAGGIVVWEIGKKLFSGNNSCGTHHMSTLDSKLD